MKFKGKKGLFFIVSLLIVLVIALTSVKNTSFAHGKKWTKK